MLPGADSLVAVVDDRLSGALAANQKDVFLPSPREGLLEGAVLSILRARWLEGGIFREVLEIFRELVDFLFRDHQRCTCCTVIVPCLVPWAQDAVFPNRYEVDFALIRHVQLELLWRCLQLRTFRHWWCVDVFFSWTLHQRILPIILGRFLLDPYAM